MSYTSLNNVEHGNLDLCKEQFTILYPSVEPSTLVAIIAYDKAPVPAGHYYACIFAKAATSAVPSSHNWPKLLIKGHHEFTAGDAIRSLLRTLSEKIGDMVAESMRTSQRSVEEWSRSNDLTRRYLAATDIEGVDSRGGTIQQIVDQDSPPAYWK